MKLDKEIYYEKDGIGFTWKFVESGKGNKLIRIHIKGERYSELVASDKMPTNNFVICG